MTAATEAPKQTTEQAEPKTATKPTLERIPLSTLEQRIVETIQKAPKRDREVLLKDAPKLRERITEIGDPTVNAGSLNGYTAERYGNGRWVSDAILKRVRMALSA